MKTKPSPSATTAATRNGAPAAPRGAAAGSEYGPMMHDLHRRAVAQMRTQRKNQKLPAKLPKSETDPQRLLHELQVHQIELEMQNEELTRSKVEAESSARKYSDLYDFAPIGYVSLDGEGRIQELNFTAAKLLGKTRANAVGKLLVSFIAPPHQDTFRRHMWAASETRTNAREEVELRAENGRRVPVQLCTLVRADVSGKTSHFLTAITDITDLKRVEAKIRRLNADLEERVGQRTATIRKLATELTLVEQREKSRLAYVLHEDLQQILVATDFDLQSASRHCSGRGKKLLRRAKRTLSQSAELARSLAVELSPPILRGDGLVAASQWLGVWMRKKHGLTVRVTVGPGHAPLPEEVSILLYQALRELLFNIVKHAQARAASVALDWMDSHVRVVVSDQGKGFEPSELPNESATGKFGLFSVRERVSLLGGKMEIESAPGRGSRFTLRVPLNGSSVRRPRNKGKEVL